MKKSTQPPVIKAPCCALLPKQVYALTAEKAFRSWAAHVCYRSSALMGIVLVLCMGPGIMWLVFLVRLTKPVLDFRKQRFLLYLQSSGFVGLQHWERCHIDSPREGTGTVNVLSWKDKLPQRGTIATCTVDITFLLFIEFEPAAAYKRMGPDLQFVQQHLTNFSLIVQVLSQPWWPWLRLGSTCLLY